MPGSPAEDCHPGISWWASKRPLATGAHDAASDCGSESTAAPAGSEVAAHPSMTALWSAPPSPAHDRLPPTPHQSLTPLTQDEEREERKERATVSRRDTPWLAAGLPSVGSATHGATECKPCAWFWKPQGCHNGRDCRHCHLCPEGEKKARKRAKMVRQRGDTPDGICDQESAPGPHEGEFRPTCNAFSSRAVAAGSVPAVVAPWPLDELPPGADLKWFTLESDGSEAAPSLPATPAAAALGAHATCRAPPGLAPVMLPASIGSMAHGTGSCRPCAWFWKPQGCQNRHDCRHCHLCAEGELKARRRAKQVSGIMAEAGVSFDSLGILADLSSAAAESALRSWDSDHGSPRAILPMESSMCKFIENVMPETSMSSVLAGDCTLWRTPPPSHPPPPPPVGLLSSPPGLLAPVAFVPRDSDDSCSLTGACMALGTVALERDLRGAVPEGGPQQTPCWAPVPETLATSRGLFMSALPPLDNPEGADSPRSPARVVPSRGSAVHRAGRCEPCAWFWKPEGCKNGPACGRCHLCPPGEVKARKKAKKTALRLGGLGALEEADLRVPRALRILPLL